MLLNKNKESIKKSLSFNKSSNLDKIKELFFKGIHKKRRDKD
jgi:hypothetical protein